MKDGQPSVETSLQETPKTVLVIDDEVAFCDVVCEILNSAGYKSLQAHNAKQAWDVLERVELDIIISDVMMPDTDGLTFIRRLRAEPRWSDLPIIVASAKATAADRQMAIEAGANGYLVKPFSSDELEAVVSETLLRT